nr:uncharacterized protein CTRU02_09171 [Colletotrichum truncatum]KAF6788850.1 hypothetical protein CTRU02_09171 [Colletotrichum truncatum]
MDVDYGNKLTTFITSTTSGLGSPDRNISVILQSAKLLMPTTTLSASPLPSNAAYPWGGIGPLFRHPHMTVPGNDDEPNEPPVVQEVNGIWWSRWKQHFDRLQSGEMENKASEARDT